MASHDERAVPGRPRPSQQPVPVPFARPPAAGSGWHRLQPRRGLQGSPSVLLFMLFADLPLIGCYRASCDKNNSHFIIFSPFFHILPLIRRILPLLYPLPPPPRPLLLSCNTCNEPNSSILPPLEPSLPPIMARASLLDVRILCSRIFLYPR